MTAVFIFIFLLLLTVGSIGFMLGYAFFTNLALQISNYVNSKILSITIPPAQEWASSVWLLIIVLPIFIVIGWTRGFNAYGQNSLGYDLDEKKLSGYDRWIMRKKIKESGWED